MSTSLTNIRNLSLEELKTSFTEFGEKPFRAKQVWEWLWQKNAHSFEQMSNLSLGFRTWLSAHFYIDAITLQDQQISKDRTIKSAFTIDD
ncbi:MAG: hypothetical protein RLZ93_1239, partial [Bacteroidota bacterium]